MPTVDSKNRLEKLRKRIKDNKNLSKGDKEVLKEFSRSMRLNDYTDLRNHKLTTHIKRIAENTLIDLKDAGRKNVEDMIEWIHSQDFAPNTIKDYKIAIRVFYRWLRNGSFNSGDYPEEVNWIRTTLKKSHCKLPNKLLNEDDVKTMIEHARNNRCKAFISLLWETGARVGELIDLTLKDIDDHPYGYQIIINGKTGPRRLPLITSGPYISRWLESHPLRNSKQWPNVPLWSELQIQDHGNRESREREKSNYDALKRDLERSAERAGIDKPVNPHHFRHSRATYMANRFTEAQMCEWFGWVPGSNMPGKYVHLAGRDIDNAYQRIHGLREEKEDQPKMLPQNCPRCELEGIEATAKFCPRCGQALTREAFLEFDKMQGTADMAMEGVMSDPELKKLIAKKIDELIANKIEES